MTPRSDILPSPLPSKREGERRTLFAGSFNPFTRGHLRIVERALKVADSVVIAVGVNISKSSPEDRQRRRSELENRLLMIEKAVRTLNDLSSHPRVFALAYEGLTAETAKKLEVDFLIRGVRNVADFEYERNLADINLKVLGVETVLLCAEPEYSYLSSSTVRELQAHGYDTNQLLP